MPSGTSRSPRPVTVRDIAKAVGVSASTVSRALTQADRVSGHLKRQIQDKAEAMGYRPNLSAQGLMSGQTKNIGVLVPDLENPLFASLVKGAQSRASLWGYSVVVSDSEEDQRLESEILKNFNGRVDAVVLFSPRTPSQELQRHASRLPMVLVNREVDGLPSITVDEHDSMRQALLHLGALGHVRVAHVSGPVRSWADQSRCEGLRAAIREMPQLSAIDLVEVGRVAPSFAGGTAAADLVFASRASAVVCYNDLIALGVLARSISRGIEVPDELSIIGYDGIAAGTFTTPSLTTISVPLQRMGRDAVDLLVSVMKSPEAAEQIRLPAYLTVRDSTAIPSAISAGKTAA